MHILEILSGLAGLEVVACGTPVAAAAVGGAPEVASDGVTGILMPRSDPSALADAIALLLNNPELRRCPDDSGRKEARERFDLEIGIGKTEAVLTATADQSGRTEAGQPLPHSAARTQP